MDDDFLIMQFFMDAFRVRHMNEWLDWLTDIGGEGGE